MQIVARVALTRTRPLSRFLTTAEPSPPCLTCPPRLHFALPILPFSMAFSESGVHRTLALEGELPLVTLDLARRHRRDVSVGTRQLRDSDGGVSNHESGVTMPRAVLRSRKKPRAGKTDALSHGEMSSGRRPAGGTGTGRRKGPERLRFANALTARVHTA